MEIEVTQPTWNKSWAEYSSEILDGIAFNSFSDATVCCNGKRIPVHQMVLAASSDYFRELLNSSMSSHPFIIFENVNLKLLELLLMFIYRGQVFVRPHEVRGLFKLAEEFKVKGLSGPVGSDVSTKCDFEPPGIDVLNLNVFRKTVNPIKIKNVDVMRHVVNALINKTPRQIKIMESCESLVSEFKLCKVRYKKYKAVANNRNRIYEKDDLIIPFLSESPESAKEREILDRFSNISLVEDSSKTFSEEAVKDLVARLTSNLKIKDQVLTTNEEEQESRKHEQHQQENENKIKIEPQQSQVEQEQLQHSQQPSQTSESSSSSLKLPTFGFTDIQMILYPDKNLPKAPDVGVKESWVNKLNRITAMSSAVILREKDKIEECITKLPIRFASSVYGCEICSFKTFDAGKFIRHRKVHLYERHKPLLERMGKEKLLERIQRVKIISGFPESISKQTSVSELTSAMREARKGSSTCIASTSRFNNNGPRNPHFESSLREKWRFMRSLHQLSPGHLANDLKMGANSPPSEGPARDNVTGQQRDRRHRRYICLYCPHKSYHKKSLLEHQKIHLLKPDKKKFKCEDCPFQTHTYLYLKIHKRSCHPLKTKDESPSTR